MYALASVSPAVWPPARLGGKQPATITPHDGIDFLGEIFVEPEVASAERRPAPRGHRNRCDHFTSSACPGARFVQYSHTGVYRSDPGTPT